MSIRSALKSKFRNSFEKDIKEEVVEKSKEDKSKEDKSKEEKSKEEKREETLLSKTEAMEEHHNGGGPEFKECVDEDSFTAPNNAPTPAVHHEGASYGPPGASYGPPSEGAPPAPARKFSTRDEKAVYELQLTQLQEQLVAAMIESQNLANEVKALKDKPEVDRLKQQLENERERNRILASQLKEGKTKPLTHFDSDDDDIFSTTSSRRPLRKRLKLRERSASATDFTDMEQDYVTVKKEDLFTVTDKKTDEVVVSAPAPRSRVYDWLASTFYELVEDFTESPHHELEPVQEGEGDPLTAKQLKENMKRFYAAGRPVMSTMRSVRGVLSWETPSMTILVLFLYVYSVWHGWLLPVTLLLGVLRLAINWLKSKGLITNFHYLPREDEKERMRKISRGEPEDKDALSDKFVLVLQVARKVQNGLGQIADSLEKLHNLLMWRHPTATRQLLLFLLAMLVASCLLQGRTLFTLIGLYSALKLFVIDYIYERYPRVRLRHDTSLRLWRELPTNAELSQRTTRAQLDQYILPASPQEEAEEPPLEPSGSDSLSSDDRHFLQLFSLPSSESPLPVWTGGRRCTLINREKSLTSAFKSGKLYLTRSFLCFERTKAASPKNLIIPLADITRIEKTDKSEGIMDAIDHDLSDIDLLGAAEVDTAEVDVEASAKPYSWMPGGGMALEVHVGSIARPLMFGALLNRDEIFESIMSVGTKAALLWAPGAPGGPQAPAESPQSNPSSPTQTKSPGPMIDKLKAGIQYIEDSD